MLEKNFFEPLSKSHRQMLGKKMIELKIISREGDVCLVCGEGAGTNNVFFCPPCFVTLCHFCRVETPHKCVG